MRTMRRPVLPHYDSTYGAGELLQNLDTEDTVDCGICLDRFHVSTLAAYADWVAPSNILTLPCAKRHSYCLDCLRAYLHTALEAEPVLGVDQNVFRRGFVVPCPGCAITASTSTHKIWIMNDALIESLLSKEDLLRWVRIMHLMASKVDEC